MIKIATLSLRQMNSRVRTHAHHIYMACPKSKCTDFPMYEMVKEHFVDVYRYVGSDLGCMSMLVSTGLVESVVR